MRIIKYGIVLILIIITGLSIASAADEKDQIYSLYPVKNGEQKWRIGYYQGGDYQPYQHGLIALVKNLTEIGWIKSKDIPPQPEKQTGELWQWLSKNVDSRYIEFVSDAHYSADWDSEKRSALKAEIIKRLKEKKDIDLMIATGTWAGQDLSTDEHQTPTIVMDASDPVAAGIVESPEKSGKDYVMARVDPYRISRQVETFHDMIGFTKLGLIYRNTPSQRSIAGVEKVEEIAGKRGFTIVNCYMPDEVVAGNDVTKIKECFHEIGKKADALYVTEQSAINKDTIHDLAETAISYNLPTFAQSGSTDVRYGFLMGFQSSDSLVGYMPVGRFYAETIAKIFNGAKPGNLNQIFEDPMKLTMNLKTAERIGYQPPPELLEIMSETYNTIEVP